jgi:endonuclease I
MFKGIPQAKKKHKQEQQLTEFGVLSSDTNTVKKVYEAQGERRCWNQNVQPAGDDDGNESKDERVDIHKMQQIQL